MKNKFFLFALIIFIMTGCVTKSSHNELEKKCQSLTDEITALNEKIDELENGEDRLVNLAKNSYDAGKYGLANNYIAQLKEKHPESKEIAYFNRLQPTLDKQIEEEKAIIEKAKKDSIKLANINNLGIWEIGYYVDNFGEATKEPYISTDLSGKFSNSATTNSDLNVRFLVDKSSIRIQLYEYAGNHPIKGEGIIYFKIRDKNGKEHEIRAFNSSTGNTNVDQDDFKKLKNILLSGGTIKFIALAGKYGSPSQYSFTIDNADWLENAYTKMELTN